MTHPYPSFRWQTSEALFRKPYGLHPYQYAYSNPVLHTDPTGKCVPEDIPIFGETGCHWIPDCFITQSNCQSLLSSGTANWGDFIRYPWEVFQGIGSPGAWIVDQFAGTNAWNCIWQNPSAGKKIGVTFTGVATGGAVVKYSSLAIRNLLLWLATLGKTAADEVANSGPPTPESQALIDDIVDNELKNVNLTFHPQYDPNLRSLGLAGPETFTKIGPEAIEAGRAEILRTIIEEELHHRIFAHVMEAESLEVDIAIHTDNIAEVIESGRLEEAETLLQQVVEAILRQHGLK